MPNFQNSLSASLTCPALFPSTYEFSTRFMFIPSRRLFNPLLELGLSSEFHCPNAPQPTFGAASSCFFFVVFVQIKLSLPPSYTPLVSLG